MCKTCAQANRCSSYTRYKNDNRNSRKKAAPKGGVIMCQICAQANRCASYMRPVADKTPESISICSQKYKKRASQIFWPPYIQKTVSQESFYGWKWVCVEFSEEECICVLEDVWKCTMLNLLCILSVFCNLECIGVYFAAGDRFLTETNISQANPATTIHCVQSV